MLTTQELTVIRPIRSDTDLNTSQARLNALIRENAYKLENGHPLKDEFDVLSDLIYAYEQQKDPIRETDLDPVEFVKFYMENRGLKQKDLAKILDISTARFSEFLNRKTEITFKLAQKLYEVVGVPAEAILKNYHTQNRRII